MANDEMSLKVQLWDIAGQDRFIGLAPTYYRHAVAAILVVDITNKSSLQNAIKWKTDIDNKVFLSNGDNIPVILFVNKWDLIQNNNNNNNYLREFSDRYLDEFCVTNSCIGWFSTSAKSGMNIKNGVNFTLSKVIEKRETLNIKNDIVKILVIGDHNTGKTSIVRRYVYKQFDEFSCEATIGMDIASKHVRINNNKHNTIGLSVGGSKDIGNFRKCIEENIQPKIGSITYNGLLYEYKFDTKTVKHIINKIDDENKENEGSNSMLFYPSYCYAKIKETDFSDKMIHKYPTPKSNDNDNDKNMYIMNDKYEYYITMGLNSNIRENDFKRKHLNLVIVLDISGSMNCAFDAYNYGNSENKILTATKSIILILNQLTDHDRFGLITFNANAQILQKLELMININRDKMKKEILNIIVGGGTNLESGYNAAIGLYDDNKNIINKKNDKYENRIIFISDAQPNKGITDSNDLLSLISKNALNKDKRIYSTIIGVGLDFNANLVDKIMKIRGCNYYTISSEKEFKNKMEKEFDYMVTPLVFNVVLSIKCEGNSCQIDKVYGPNQCCDDILKNGEIVRIHTLFPSKQSKESGEIKGGILLIKLKKNKNVKCDDDNINIMIEIIFEDRNNNKYINKQNVILKDIKIEQKKKEEKEEKIEDLTGNFYDNNGIRKGILLCKYSELLMEWIKFEEKRGSHKLTINRKYKNIFNNFCNYFEKEMKICKDDTLQKEVDILKKLTKLKIIHDINNNHHVKTVKSVSSYFENLYNGLINKWYQ